MPQTLVEKIIARASGRDNVRQGEIVTCKVDLAMLTDSGGPRRIWPRLKELGVGVWDPDKVVLVTDHFAPAVFHEQDRCVLHQDLANWKMISNPWWPYMSSRDSDESNSRMPWSATSRRGNAR